MARRTNGQKPFTKPGSSCEIDASARHTTGMEQFFTNLSHAAEGAALIALGAAVVWGVLSIVLSPCHPASIPLIVGLRLLGVFPMPWSGPGQVGWKRKGLLAALVLGLVFGIALGWAGNRARVSASHVVGCVFNRLSTRSHNVSGRRVPWPPAGKKRAATDNARLDAPVAFG
jgi:hypothetical protein